MKILKYLNQPSQPQGLGLFRIFFGLIILWDLKRFNEIKIVESFYAHDPIFHYEFLNLPLPEIGTLKLLMGVLFICAILVTLGVIYRWAMVIFALGFSYFFFLDPVLYNNHLYLLCLISFIMIFLPADGAFSLNKKRKRGTVPQWSYRLLQFHIVLVYFFGGIVKLNPYWLDFHPVEEVLHAAANRTGTDLFLTDWMKYLFAYGGIAFDLLIGALLLIKKTRFVAIISAVLFNLLNSYVFNDIFIFPFFMIAALLLFMDQEKLYGWLQRRKLIASPISKLAGTPLKKSGLILIGAYVLFHLVMPLRHYFIPGYTDWTGEAQRFSWRMKIQYREVEEVQFAIFDTDKNIIYEINPKKTLFPDEVDQMCNSPQLILQFAHYLNDVIAPKNGVKNCWVKCKIKVKFNGKPSTYIFDPELDLIEASEKHESINDWINQLPK